MWVSRFFSWKMKVTPKNRWLFHPSAWWVKGWNSWLGSDQSLMSCSCSFTFGRHKSSKYIQMIADTTSTGLLAMFVLLHFLLIFATSPLLAGLLPTHPPLLEGQKWIPSQSLFPPCPLPPPPPVPSEAPWRGLCLRRHLWSTVGCDGGVGDVFIFHAWKSVKKNLGLSPNLWDMKNI